MGSRLVWLVVAAFSGGLAGCSEHIHVSVRSELVRPLKRIAIVDLLDAPGADAGYSGRVVAGVLSSMALKVEGWTLVERQNLKRIIDEQDLQSTNLVDPSTAVEVGRLAGADAIIVGEVSQYRIGSIPFLFFMTWDQDTYKVDYTFRVLSVKTGEVCAAARISGSSLESFEHAIGTGAAPAFKRISACRSKDINRR